MGQRLWYLFLQIAACIVVLVALFNLATLFAVFGETLKQAETPAPDGQSIGRTTAIVVWSMMIDKEILTLTVAVTAFVFAKHKRRERKG